MPPALDVRTLTFAEPFYLWLLLAPGTLVVLWVWRVFGRRADVQRYRNEQVVPVHERYSLVGDFAYWPWLMVAAALCIGALARPQARVTALVRTGSDIIVLQDGSASMYVKDVKPDRWQRSVRFLRTFAEGLAWNNGDRAALALFAHIATPQLRLSKDPNAMFFFLDHLGEQSPFRLEDDPTWDTNIEEGVYWGLQLLERDEELFGRTKNPKAFVVISDGQAWSGDVADALRTARKREVVVYVVGVGTTTGGLIPEPPRPNDPVATMGAIRSVLDRDSLRTIARMGGGEYFEIGRDPDRDIAQRILTSVKRHGLVSHVEESYQELYWHLLFAAAVALGLGTFALKSGTELWWQVCAVVITLAVVAIAIG
jgi:Ca-activated chloride channel family protein